MHTYTYIYIYIYIYIDWELASTASCCESMWKSERERIDSKWFRPSKAWGWEKVEKLTMFGEGIGKLPKLKSLGDLNNRKTSINHRVWLLERHELYIVVSMLSKVRWGWMTCSSSKDRLESRTFNKYFCQHLKSLFDHLNTLFSGFWKKKKEKKTLINR